MPKIRFISDPKIPNDKVKDWEDYLKNSEHEVSNDEADRWLRRGNAEVVRVKEEVISKEIKKIEPKPEPESKKEEVKEPEVKEPEIKSDEEIKSEVKDTETPPRTILEGLRSIPRRV